VTLQAVQLQTDPDGGAYPAWNDVATVWGRVEPLRISETLIAAQVAARVTHRITLRYRGDVQPDWQCVLETGQVYEVTGVRNLDTRNRTVELLAIEKVTV
jgi:SPP1 family predicted phage head-tail adaptor